MTTSETVTNDALAKIDLSRCDIHPLLRNVRFDYSEDIEKLCELIHVNGQELPGIAVPVPGKEGYWVTIGNRRLLACKLCQQKYGTPETFLAIIKTNLSEEDIVIGAYVENLSEGGGRKDLCFLEEASSLSEMIAKFPREFMNKFAIGTNTTEEAVQRKIDLIKRLDDEMVSDLHKIERHVDPPFYFTSDHVESFVSRRLNREKLLKIAALVAERRVAPSFIDAYAFALNTGNVGEPGWLHELFQDLGRSEELAKEKAAPQRGEIVHSSYSTFMKNAVGVACYNCGFQNPFESTLRGVVNFLNPPDPTHKESMEPISYLLPPKVCWNCGKPFQTMVRGRKVESSAAVEESEEESTTDSRLGVIDFIPIAKECKVGCMLCHLILATKEGRFKFDHATGQFTIRIEEAARDGKDT